MKIKLKLEKIKKIINKTLEGNVINIIIIVAVCVFVFFLTKNTFKDNKDIDSNQNIEATELVSSEESLDEGDGMTEEEIYDNEYFKHIRVGLNGYLNGSNIGVEDFAITQTTLDDGTICGLDNFDKSYYKSKLIILNTSTNKYGGLQADFFFIDKPDLIFWAWVYRLDGDGDYVLRGFCESNLFNNIKDPEFIEIINNIIRETEYYL